MYIKNQGYRFLATIKQFKKNRNQSFLLLINPTAKTEDEPLRDHVFMKIPKTVFEKLQDNDAKVIEFSADVENYTHANKNLDYLKQKHCLAKPRKFEIIQ